MSHDASQIEARVDAILAGLTLEEKLGQMSQYPRLAEDDRERIRRGEVGSSIFASSQWAGKDMPSAAKAEFANAFQREAVERSRAGIPVLFARDVIHGHRTVFPIPLGQAATWSPERVEQGAAVAAREAAAEGIKWVFTPMLDIARDPRWGRIAEGFGEDPWLAAALAAAAVRGYQGDDPAAPDRVLACAKHYVGYGFAEGGRDYDRTQISAQDLEDICLPPFHAAVRAGVATIMSGFHNLNGTPLSSHAHLLTEVLRHRWGFRGPVVSDWNAVAELMAHGVAANKAEAAQLALRAGVDMEMVSDCYRASLAEAVRAGRLPESYVNQATRRILRAKVQAGLFETPYTDPARATQVTLTPAHRALARQVAGESLVLLKNSDGLLPLGDRFKHVVVLGELAGARDALFGTWTLDGQGADVTPIADAIRAAAPAGVRVTAVTAYPDKMVAYAHQADAVVLVVGEEPTRSGEASSIAEIVLPPGQRELIEAVALNDVPVILVVVAGRPLALARETRLVQALVYAWHPGVEGGHAVADLLFGRIEPQGRLPVSFPRVIGQVPVYYNHPPSGRPARARGYSSAYMDVAVGPLFPFGYGLAYTTFAYDELTVSGPVLRGDGAIEVAARITNTGTRPGVETAQLYVRDRVASVSRPVRELKGFQKVALQPGASERVVFRLTADDLVFAGADGALCREAGAYDVWIAPDSASGLKGEFTLEGV